MRTSKLPAATWVLAAAAIAALPASWYWWSVERAAAAHAQATREGLATSAPLQQRAAERLRKWEATRDRLAAAQAQLARRGDTPAEWQQRTVTVDGQRMSRHEAEQYLRSLMTSHDAWLVPSAIHLKAARSGESVFVEHEGEDRADALVVTIKAEFHSRRAP